MRDFKDLPIANKKLHYCGGQVWILLSLYWRRSEKLSAWFFLILLVVLSLLAVGVALAINEWYRHFYNAISDKDVGRFYLLLALFLLVVTVSVLRATLIGYAVDMLALRWRRWLTDYFLMKWEVSTCPELLLRQVDNPDQRIAEDVNKFTFEFVDLGCGLVYTVASLVSFGWVLVSISGEFEIFGFAVPNYMFWVAIVYALIGTIACRRIGSRLVGFKNEQQRAEANLRRSLIAFAPDRTNGPAPAIKIGHRAKTRRDFIHVTVIRRMIIRVNARLSLFTEGYGQMALLLSSVLAAPRYFLGEIEFGQVMQINSAFGNVCENLSWVINVYPRLADLAATTERLVTLDLALDMYVS